MYLYKYQKVLIPHILNEALSFHFPQNCIKFLMSIGVCSLKFYVLYLLESVILRHTCIITEHKKFYKKIHHFTVYDAIFLF